MNWKTTTAGGSGALVTMIYMILKGFGVEIPEEVILGAISIASFLVAYFAKDKDKSGIFKVGNTINVSYPVKPVNEVPKGYEIVVDDKPPV